MKFVQNGRKHQVSAGSIFLVQMDQDNEFLTEPGKHCHKLACLLEGHDLNSILLTLKLLEFDVISPDNFDEIVNLAWQCFELMRDKPQGFRYNGSAMGYNLLLALAKNIQKETKPKTLINAIGLMERHVEQALTLKELVKALNTSPASLNRMFRKYLNKSPIDYWIELKMKAAAELLEKTSSRIKEVAAKTGYANPLYFSAEFKKRFGISPRDYRKQHVDSNT